MTSVYQKDQMTIPLLLVQKGRSTLIQLSMEWRKKILIYLEEKEFASQELIRHIIRFQKIKLQSNMGKDNAPQMNKSVDLVIQLQDIHTSHQLVQLTLYCSNLPLTLIINHHQVLVITKWHHTTQNGICIFQKVNQRTLWSRFMLG